MTIIDKEYCLLNITNHKKEIKKTRNVVIKIFRSLQILKNYLQLWEYQLISQDKKLKEINIFLSPARLISMAIKKYSNIKRFMILHDTIPLINSVPSPEGAKNWFIPLIQSLDTETYCFCVSEHTKNDFIKFAGSHIDKNKMFVTPIASSQQFYPNYNKAALSAVLKKYGIQYKTGDNYIFSFCSIDPRKNLLFTIECFVRFIEKNSIQNLCFYLGGDYFASFKKEFEEKLTAYPDYQNKIVYMGYVDDTDVNILYSNSLFFVYLSQYEGFGMPPLEAMQAGTPVITSNNSSLPEVVGDAAIQIIWNDEAACIKAFEALYFNKSLREEYIAKGLERAKLFSWKKTVDIMAEKMLEAVNYKEE